MGQKIFYKITGKQIAALAFASAIIAVGVILIVINFTGITNAFQNSERTNVAFSNKPVTGISNPSVATDEQNSIEVYKAVSPGVAFITTSSKFENFFGEQFERESGNGSGSVIDNQGHILTNYHVIEGASKLTVSFGGEKVYPAKLVGGDPDTDLAVIQIIAPTRGLTVIQLGDSDRLEVGQKVLAIGNPFGLDRTLTTGVISGLQRPIRARNDRPIDAAIQTDASINPGNSGGPLLDKYGRLIGINSQILSPAGGSVGVGFAIPVNTAKRIVPQLIKFGEVRRPDLGAVLRSVEELGQRNNLRLPVEKGLLVLRTYSGGAADRAGIRGLSSDSGGMILGDIILSAEGESLGNMDDLYRFLDKKKIGDSVDLTLFRNGSNVTVPVTLVQTPVSNRSRGRTIQ
ncbi:MAG: trypsin-like peptidase domain-containing protein [Acidobacteria bacterium]|nr:trypsin-like peptidase domain-containing protein [Acidobacteriota bacterium]